MNTLNTIAQNIVSGTVVAGLVLVTTAIISPSAFAGGDNFGNNSKCQKNANALRVAIDEMYGANTMINSCVVAGDKGDTNVFGLYLEGPDAPGYQVVRLQK